MNRLSLKNLLITYIFMCIIIIGSVAIFLNVDTVNDQGLVIVTFLINGLIIFFELSRSTKLGYSLKDIFFLFMFIFMFISPLIQYLEDTFPWWDTYLITEEKVVQANLIITIFLLVYISIYKISFKNDENNYKIISKEIRNIKLVIDIFFVASVFCSLYIIGKTGFSNLFARATNSLQIEASSIALIVSNTFRSVPVIYVAMNLLFILKNKKIYRKIPFFIGSLLMILVNFPTATARFWMASVYLGLLIIIKRNFKNPHFFKIVIFIGILIIFPAINVFRHHTFEEVIKQGIRISKPTDEFLSGNFDSYSMLVRSTLYVDLYGITRGQQLLGNLLFFVPRKIWPAKPIGTGAMIARELGWHFSNVSCPYIGEGYINFGIVGVILFAAILAKLTALGDKTYMKSGSSQDQITFIDLIYPFSLGFLFFILRGDLLSSLSFYIGFMVPIMFLWIIQK